MLWGRMMSPLAMILESVIRIALGTCANVCTCNPRNANGGDGADCGFDFDGRILTFLSLHLCFSIEA